MRVSLTTLSFPSYRDYAREHGWVALRPPTKKNIKEKKKRKEGLVTPPTSDRSMRLHCGSLLLSVPDSASADVRFSDDVIALEDPRNQSTGALRRSRWRTAWALYVSRLPHREIANVMQPRVALLCWYTPTTLHPPIDLMRFLPFIRVVCDCMTLDNTLNRLRFSLTEFPATKRR